MVQEGYPYVEERTLSLFLLLCLIWHFPLSFSSAGSTWEKWGAPVVSQAEGVAEGSLMEAEAMVGNGEGCEPAGGSLFTC